MRRPLPDWTMRPSRFPASRAGLTLVECLVVIGIIGVLVSLLMPAVQSAREAARRASCANNLRQIMIALNSYEALHSAYPHVMGFSGIVKHPKHYSAFTQFLGHLDLPQLFHTINFDWPTSDPYSPPRHTITGFPENRTVMSTRIGLFLCPSDGGGGDPGWTGGVNYRFSIGVERWCWFSPNNSTSGVISLGWRGVTRAASVRDGLSQTVCMSEKPRGAVGGPRDLRTAMVYGARGFPTSAEGCYETCSRLPPTAEYYGATGLSWFIGSLAHTAYNHVHAPNSRVPDCISRNVIPPAGLAGARSNHGAGVNAAMADGSVRFVSSAIDRSVWKALGTRAGGESIDSNW